MSEPNQEVEILKIAQVCHETNRAYCASLGDFSQMPWEQAPKWQRDSAIWGVRYHLAGTHRPSGGHRSWLKQKVADGWKYGPIKNVETKEHPCMVPYKQLPQVERMKDYLFRAVVQAFKDCK